MLNPPTPSTNRSNKSYPDAVSLFRRMAFKNDRRAQNQIALLWAGRIAPWIGSIRKDAVDIEMRGGPLNCQTYTGPGVWAASYSRPCRGNSTQTNTYFSWRSLSSSSQPDAPSGLFRTIFCGSKLRNPRWTKRSHLPIPIPIRRVRPPDFVCGRRPIRIAHGGIARSTLKHERLKSIWGCKSMLAIWRRFASLPTSLR